MIPDLITKTGCLWPLLPPGIHTATMDEVYNMFVTNPRKKDLFEGLKRGADNLFHSGSPELYLDGGYVTANPSPSDYDVCWNGSFVDPNILDPVFLDFTNGRKNQKIKYLGEYFLTTMIEGLSRKPFLDFFQTDKHTGQQKGIIRITNYIKRK